MRSVAPAGPYSVAATDYWTYGWTPLPLPPKQKTWPPNDWTGSTKEHSNEYPEEEQLKRWIAKLGDGNICIRLPEDVIGIDVDVYDEKKGRETLAAAEEAWGALPATWYSSSRVDGSGIRLFRIPTGLSWPGKLPQGGGVEIVRWDHRYVVCAPSVHPNGAQYRWWTPEGEMSLEEFPEPSELPDLPQAWIDGLTSGKPWVARSEGDLTSEEVTDWLKARGDDAMCEVMERTLALHLNKLRKAGPDGGAHEAMTDGVWALIGDSAAGHSGIRKALERFAAAFKEAVKGRRSVAERRGEWRRSLEDGVRKVAAEGEPETEDICSVSAVSRPAKQRKRSGGSSSMEFERDDIGNGQRFALQWRDEVRWVPEFEKWYVWSDKVWTPDPDGEIGRMAAKTARDMRSEAAFIEDPKEKAAFLKFVRSSSNEGKLRAMLNQAKTNKGVTVSAAAFDANPSHLVCGNGTLDLPIEFSGTRIRRLPSIQEHFNTVMTGVDYVPDAELPEWDKFLERFQPDIEVREWLQKLVGYSLLGRNPRRLMIVALGDTSTGKSTFAEAISGALGAYAGSANMTIFRDNQDDKPRPDLLRVLPKRFVYAEEASRSWHLHPDQIKRVTGGTPITARAMRSNEYVDRVPAFTPWLFTNHAPTIEGGDAALWRRILVVPFNVQIPKNEEDARFAAALSSPAGRQAILAWLVEGYAMYLASPDSLQEIPSGAMLANASFRAEVSDLAICLEEICEFGPDLWIAPEDLYQAYRAWCEINNTPARDILSGTKFGREVNGDYAKKMRRVEGKPARVRTGLALKTNWIRHMTGS